jgi:hypothetical protein
MNDEVSGDFKAQPRYYVQIDDLNEKVVGTIARAGEKSNNSRLVYAIARALVK